MKTRIHHCLLNNSLINQTSLVYSSRISLWNTPFIDYQTPPPKVDLSNTIHDQILIITQPQLFYTNHGLS